MPLLAAHITMGGSPIDFCSARKLSYADVIAWIYADPGRTRQYQVSLNARAEWLIQRVLLELGRLAYVDIREAYNDDGTLKDVHTLSDNLAASISSIESNEEYDEDGKLTGYLKKIKLWDKKAALDMLGKHLALFQPENFPPPEPAERHLHLHFEDLSSGELTDMLLGRHNGRRIDAPKLD